DLGDLHDAAGKIGIATEELSGLRLAAEEVGIEANAFDKGLVKMSRSVAEVAGGTGEAADAFGTLGLAADKMMGMAPEEQFRLIADSINNIPSPAEKLDVAMSIFGKAGADMVNVLAMGRDGLDETQKAAERLGIALGGD